MIAAILMNRVFRDRSVDWPRSEGVTVNEVNNGKSRKFPKIRF